MAPSIICKGSVNDLFYEDFKKVHIYMCKTLRQTVYRRVVIRNLLASDNAFALLCKHHENRSENVTQVSVFTRNVSV